MTINSLRPQTFSKRDHHVTNLRVALNQIRQFQACEVYIDVRQFIFDDLHCAGAHVGISGGVIKVDVVGCVFKFREDVFPIIPAFLVKRSESRPLLSLAYRLLSLPLLPLPFRLLRQVLRVALAFRKFGQSPFGVFLLPVVEIDPSIQPDEAEDENRYDYAQLGRPTPVAGRSQKNQQGGNIPAARSVFLQTLLLTVRRSISSGVGKWLAYPPKFRVRQREILNKLQASLAANADEVRGKMMKLLHIGADGLHLVVYVRDVPRKLGPQ